MSVSEQKKSEREREWGELIGRTMRECVKCEKKGFRLKCWGGVCVQYSIVQ